VLDDVHMAKVEAYFAYRRLDFVTQLGDRPHARSQDALLGPRRSHGTEAPGFGFHADGAMHSPDQLAFCGNEGEVSMAAHGTSQVGTRARRSAVSVGDPVPAAKITAPGVPEWAVQRPRITKLIAEDVRWC
jgi:hypothetical protein